MEHLGGYNFTTDGLPAGRIGLYTEAAATKFNYLTVSNNAAWAPMTDAWQNYNDDALTNEQAINTNTDRLYFTRGHNPLPVLMGASGGGGRVNRFRTTFALRMEQTHTSGGGATQKLFFLFNAKDAEHTDGLMLFVGPSSAPQGQRWEDGKLQTSVSGSGTSANWPSFTVGDVQWVEITHDGSTLTVKAQKTATEPSDASWSGVGAAYTSTNFSTSGGGGGRIGFRGDIAYVSVDDLKLWADTDSNGSYEALVHHESFTLDSSGYDDNAPTHDAAGNLTYASASGGGSKYTYDAWNRLVKVTKAYRDPSNGTVQANLVVSTSAYDGMGRRIVKTVQNSAYLDATYHTYYNPGGHSAIEVRDGSNLVLKQQVWGLTYIDELVQISLNDDPADGMEDDCESHYFALQDANFNVLGVVDSSGALRERYEYSPYGERKVFTTPGVNDPLCYAPIDISRRWTVGSTLQPYGLCEVGHQGLWHDEETGLVYNRARMLHTGMGRFLQRDPMEYVDGLNIYRSYHATPGNVDPTGTKTVRFWAASYIPWSWVRIQPGNQYTGLNSFWVAGDSRGPSNRPGGSYRTMVQVTVELCEQDEIAKGLRSPVESEVGINSSSTLMIENVFGWTVALIHGKGPFTYSVYPQRVGPKSVNVTLRASGSVPWYLAGPQPPIDFSYTVALTEDQSATGASGSLTGIHDGFPAHEFFVFTDHNGIKVHSQHNYVPRWFSNAPIGWRADPPLQNRLLGAAALAGQYMQQSVARHVNVTY